MRSLALLLVALLPLSCAETVGSDSGRPPNILLAIADDWGVHAGAYGTRWIRTPAFDRVANEGLLFRRAYTPMAKCAPSRSILLTGRHLWQLEAAANHLPFFPPKFKTWPEALMERGWHVGFTGKGWAPGIANDVNGRPRLMTGKPFQKRKCTPPTPAISSTDYAANFVDFLDSAPPGRPWCFWFGAHEPHRPYTFGSGTNNSDKTIRDIDRVPAYWPDHELVRTDMLDYAYEVEHADNHLARMIAELEKRGLLDQTFIIVTSDHGMPFPRVKGYAYHAANHVPFAVRWPAGIAKSGRIIDDFVDFTDVAPTILDLARISHAQSGMQPIAGKSLRPIFGSRRAGQVLSDRTSVFVAKERTDVGRPHDWGYPIRGVVTAQFLYLHNYEPSRWPAGNPETGYLDTDGSPTKSLILERGRQNRADPFWQLNFGFRPADELYDLATDPDCVTNLAENPAYAAQVKRTRREMEFKLKTLGDPRMFGRGHVFDEYPPTSGAGFYEKFMHGEKPPANWVNETDFE